MQLITTLIILLIALLIAHFFILHTGTQIGEKGHKNALSQNIIGIFEAVIVLILGIFWALNSYGSYRLYSLGGILLAGILLISSIIGLKGVLAETREDLSTERLTNIEVIPDGYRNLMNIIYVKGFLAVLQQTGSNSLSKVGRYDLRLLVRRFMPAVEADILVVIFLRVISPHVSLQKHVTNILHHKPCGSV